MLYESGQLIYAGWGDNSKGIQDCRDFIKEKSLTAEDVKIRRSNGDVFIEVIKNIEL